MKFSETQGERLLRAQIKAYEALGSLELIEGPRLASRGLITEATAVSRARVALDRCLEQLRALEDVE